MKWRWRCSSRRAAFGLLWLVFAFVYLAIMFLPVGTSGRNYPAFDYSSTAAIFFLRNPGVGTTRAETGVGRKLVARPADGTSAKIATRAHQRCDARRDLRDFRGLDEYAQHLRYRILYDRALDDVRARAEVPESAGLRHGAQRGGNHRRGTHCDDAQSLRATTTALSLHAGVRSRFHGALTGDVANHRFYDGCGQAGRDHDAAPGVGIGHNARRSALADFVFVFSRRSSR